MKSKCLGCRISKITGGLREPHPTVPTAPPMSLPNPNSNRNPNPNPNHNPKTKTNPNPILKKKLTRTLFWKKKQNDTRIQVNIEL